MNSLMNSAGNWLSSDLAKHFEVSKQGHLRISSLGANFRYMSECFIACDFQNKSKVYILDIRKGTHKAIFEIDDNYSIKAAFIINNVTRVIVWATKNGNTKREWKLFIFNIETGILEKEIDVRLSPNNDRCFNSWSICETSHTIYIYDSGDTSVDSVIIAIDTSSGNVVVHTGKKLKRDIGQLRLYPTYNPDLILCSVNMELLLIETSDMSVKSSWDQASNITNIISANTQLEVAIWLKDYVYIADITARKIRCKYRVRFPGGNLAMFYSADDKYLTVLNTTHDVDHVVAEIIDTCKGKSIGKAIDIQKDFVDERLRLRMNKYDFSKHIINDAYQFLYFHYYSETCDYVHFPTHVVYCKHSNKIGVCCQTASNTTAYKKAILLINIGTMGIETFPFPDNTLFNFLALRKDCFSVCYVEKNDPLPSFRVMEIWDIDKHKIIEKLKSPWRNTGDNWTEEQARKLFCHMLKYEEGIHKEAITSLENIRAYNDLYFIQFVDNGKRVQVFDKKFELVDTINLSTKAMMAAFSNYDHAFYLVDEANYVRRYEIRQQHISTDKITCRFTNEKFPESYFQDSADGRYLCVRKNPSEGFPLEYRILDTRDGVYVKVPNNPLWDISYYSLFDKNMRIRINQLTYAGVIRFFDAMSYEELATLKLFKDRRFLWQTPPDQVAESGWIFTNKPDKLGTFSERGDGSIKMLQPGDSLREAYIQNHSRPDIIQKRLSQGSGSNAMDNLKMQIELQKTLGAMLYKSLPDGRK